MNRPSEEPNARSILVLDDSEDLLLLAKVLIERLCKHKAITIKSLGEIEQRQQEALVCDLAILDINLGSNQPNGVDVYRWLRANGFCKPIYFLTGHARTYPLVVDAERLGDAKVLTKPIHPDEFIKIVHGNCNVS